MSKNKEEMNTEVQQPKPNIVHNVHVDMDNISRLVAAQGDVDLELMPDVFVESRAYDLPVIDDSKTYVDTLPNGRKVVKPQDIGYQNRDRFAYAWLSAEVLQKPQFRGYRIVTRGCGADQNPDGEKIPEHYWAGRDRIQPGGETVLCFAKKGFAKSSRDRSLNRCMEKLKKFTDPNNKMIDSVRTQDGLLLGGTEITKFEAYAHQSEEG